MTVTVYSKPGCPQCVATERELAQLGIAYAHIDITEQPAARERLIAAGWRSAPVVETDADAWSGYQPERIRALATAATVVHAG